MTKKFTYIDFSGAEEKCEHISSIREQFEERARLVIFERHKKLDETLYECLKRGPGYAVVVPEVNGELIYAPAFRSGDNPQDPYITTEEEASKARRSTVYTLPKMSNHKRMELIAQYERNKQ
jgi:hypothetical protein